MNKARNRTTDRAARRAVDDLIQKDFLLTWRQTDADLNAVLLAAEILEELYRANISTPRLRRRPRGLELPRQVDPHALLLRQRREPARPHRAGPRREQVAGRPTARRCARRPT